MILHPILILPDRVVRIVGVLDFSDRHIIAVCLICLHQHAIADFMAQNRPTERGLSADHIVNRTSTDTCHELVDLFLVIILHEKRHCVVQSNLILAGGIRDHNRILEQILQIADSALILILFSFCRMVLKIFTQIAVGTRFLDRLNQFRSLLKFSLVNLLLNFLYVVAYIVSIIVE